MSVRWFKVSFELEEIYEGSSATYHTWLDGLGSILSLDGRCGHGGRHQSAEKEEAWDDHFHRKRGGLGEVRRLNCREQEESCGREDDVGEGKERRDHRTCLIIYVDLLPSRE
jgi:hypothetical protein